MISPYEIQVHAVSVVWNNVTSVRINFHKVVDMERAGAIINDGAD